MERAVAHTVEQILAQVSPAAGRRSGILDLLQKIEAAVGYVPLESLPELAQSLGVSEAQVAGVLSYYPDLHTRPTGRHLLRICLGEACVANHGERVLHILCGRLGAASGTTTPDGRFTIEKIYCAGNCGVSPTLVIDGELHGRVTPEQIPGILARYQ
jgi:NADH:ubiquinone oxidoreductase subunit E